ncbi:MAG: hypothetical protein UY92_C0003G0042 [Candidatus Magasanikbacteria bacterium GW2011_GWA2_56_11]|uniref:Uncharacterized protein n=1 Tax=Candidatus Magasanikbacteria bacterium GW2011_GWA2_56_11 TaxID=1619044 RepID=A0A0G1YHX7_9BACT|nr:MAG: hypothetical protein UY92_C0003G0042 [Candidatus Magasanikbacteria bacterium GW2011_GWA2_56_11]
MSPINLHDPDFDSPSHTMGKSPAGLPARFLFAAGIVAGFLSVCTVGFFILLAVLIKN